jgi:hypothetical protein
MTRKRKADKEAEEAEFRRQSSTFKNTHVIRANFHTVNNSGTTVKPSILGRTHNYAVPHPKTSTPDLQLAHDEHDDGLIDEVPSPAKRQTQASAAGELLIHVLMLAVIYTEQPAAQRFRAAFRRIAGPHAGARS